MFQRCQGFVRHEAVIRSNLSEQTLPGDPDKGQPQFLEWNRRSAIKTAIFYLLAFAWKNPCCNFKRVVERVCPAWQRLAFGKPNGPKQGAYGRQIEAVPGQA